MYIMCVCLFSALSCRVGALQTSIIIIIIIIQGSRCLLEICVNQRETLCILHQWHEKCVQYNLELTHITPVLNWANLSSRT